MLGYTVLIIDNDINIFFKEINILYVLRVLYVL